MNTSPEMESQYFKDVAPEEIDAAFEALEPNKVKEDDISLEDRKALEQLRDYRNIREQVKQAAAQDSADSEQRLAELRAKMKITDAESLHATVAKGATVSITGEAAEHIKTLGRIIDTQSAGFGKDVRNIHNEEVQSPFSVESITPKTASFERFSEPASEANPSLITLTELQRREQEEEEQRMAAIAAMHADRRRQAQENAAKRPRRAPPSVAA